jgi:hypothetical protein
MNKKETFLHAVRILAPGDSQIMRAAEQVSEETLPVAPGGVALEFVAAMHRATTPLPCRSRFKPAATRHQALPAPGQSQPRMHLNEALKVKGAEYWLKLGQPARALVELQSLPEDAQKHPWTLKVHIAALGAVRRLNEQSIQE